MAKHIRLTGVFTIATGAMISSGIFILPSLAFSQLGPAVSLAYLIAGLLAFCGSFSIMELATAMPKSGGDYYFIHKTFGGFIGSISGIFGWFALSLKSAFAIFGISEVLLRFLGIAPALSGLVLCALFVLLNAVGTKEAITLQNLLVFFLLGLLLLYSLAGITLGLQTVAEGSRIPELWRAIEQGFHWHNLNSQSKWLNLLAVSSFVFVSFGGLLKVTNIAEEIDNPKRNLPLGMSLSIIVVTVLYVLINIILVAVVPSETLQNSLAPVADSARLIVAGFGLNQMAANIAYHIVLLASLFAFITTANAGIMAASRYPMALSRDKLLPAWIGKVHPRYQTPIPALALTGAIIAIALFLPLSTLVKAASAAVLSSYILTNLALIIFRESRVTNYQPSFRAPFYPWLQIIAIIIFGFFVVDIGSRTIGISLFFLIFSIAIYWFYGRKHGSHSFALVYLLRRIIDRHLDSGNLEDELLDVLLYRDDVKLNTFQEMVHKAEILDLPYSMAFANMLKASSKTLATETGLTPEVLEQRFLQRQAEGSTAFSPFLAIPHFITEGEHELFMQIIRCKEGIYFDEQHGSVKAIFLLGGGPHQRRKHLECLATIATMAEETLDFEQQWLSANSVSELRNLVINLGSMK